MKNSNYKSFVGIDLSKKTLDYTILNGKEIMTQAKVANNANGLEKLKAHLKKLDISLSETLVCCENTGSCSYPLTIWSEKENIAIWIENAKAIKNSLGLVRGKDDKIDSYRIALYASRFEDECQLYCPPREEIKKLSKLMRTRNNFIKMKTQIRKRLSEAKDMQDLLSYNIMDKHYQKTVQEIKNSLDQIDQEVKNLINSDSQLQENFKIISSVEGAGPVTAIMIIIETREFTRIKDPRKMACHIGIAPFKNTSGTSVKGRTKVSHLANKKLKSILHMGAVSVAHGKGELADYFQKMLKKGKHVMSIYNAIKNKIIHRIYACVRDRRIYEKEYPKKDT